MSEQYVTPQTEHPELAAIVGTPRLFLKREDLHPYGSHKGRSIPVMIDMKTAHSTQDFVISSSGNAALAALRYIQEKNKDGAGLSLSILIGERINPDKKHRLISEIRDGRITVSESKRPLQSLLKKIKGEKRESLRQSTSDDALIGYGSLADELSSIPNLSDVFIGASSGTAAQAMAEYFEKRDIPAVVHIVQTTRCSPLAKSFDKGASEEETSAADAIVDKTAHRREALVPLLERTGGSGWIASNKDIAEAQELLRKSASVEATANGALGLAGLLRARAKGRSFKGTVVCVITGA